MSVLQNTPIVIPDETEKALILHPTASRRRNHAAIPPPQTGAPPSLSFEIDLADSFLRHWILAIVIFALISAFGIRRAILSSNPVYQAESTIFISPDLAKEIGNGYTENSYSTFVNQQIMSLLHSDTLTEALRRLKEKHVVLAPTGESNSQAVDRLRGMLQVQRVPDSFEVSVQATASNAGIAATIANTVAQAFIEEENRPDASGNSDQKTSFASQREGLQKELKEKMDARAQLAQALQVVNLDKNSSLPDDVVLSEAHQALAAAHTKRIEIEAQIAAGAKTVSIDAIQLASVDPTSRTSLTALLQRQAELRSRIKNMLPAHPVRKEAETELAAIDAELNQGTGNDAIPKATEELMSKLNAQAQQYRRIERDLGREIAEINATIPTQSRNLKLAEMVNADIARLQGELGRVAGKMDEFSMRNSQSSMRIFSLAQVPSEPIKSREAKAIIFALLSAVLLALGVPVLLDIVDSRIQAASTVEKITGLPIVGMTVERTDVNQRFADEQLRRLSIGIERSITAGASKLLFTTLKGNLPATLVEEIASQLREHGTTVAVDPADHVKGGSSPKQDPLETLAINSNAIEPCQVVMFQSPALMLSAEAERLATKADLTLVIVEAGSDTRSDLARGTKHLERLNVNFIVILDNVNVDRAGRTLKRDLKEYNALQTSMGRRTDRREALA